jgi:hypothetical protein
VIALKIYTTSSRTQRSVRAVVIGAEYSKKLASSFGVTSATIANIALMNVLLLTKNVISTFAMN